MPLPAVNVPLFDQLPAMLMAAARLNLPSVFVYNGSTLPGVHDGKNIDITTLMIN